MELEFRLLNMRSFMRIEAHFLPATSTIFDGIIGFSSNERFKAAVGGRISSEWSINSIFAFSTLRQSLSFNIFGASGVVLFVYGVLFVGRARERLREVVHLHFIERTNCVKGV